MAPPLVAGVEMGGTKCMLTLATGPDDIRAQQRLPTGDPESTLAAIEAVLDAWPGFAALGIAAFGPLQLDPAAPDYGSMVATPKPGWRDVPVLARLSRRYGVPCGIETDVVGAALAEGRWGAARGLGDHLYITIGTGVGVGVIAQGRPLRGAIHSEAGHMRLPRAPGDSFPGTCPFHGDCAEGLFAGPALAQRFGVAGADIPDNAPGWEPVVAELASFLHNLIVTLGPERIALGGGVVADRPWLFPRLRGAVAESLGGYGLFGRYAGELEARLGPPGLGAEAGPLGAIAVGLAALV